jgi:hypothetical protein
MECGSGPVNRHVACATLHPLPSSNILSSNAYSTKAPIYSRRRMFG